MFLFLHVAGLRRFSRLLAMRVQRSPERRGPAQDALRYILHRRDMRCLSCYVQHDIYLVGL